MKNGEVEEIVFKIVKQVRDSIIDLEGIEELEYRRDFDGISSLDFLIEKVVGNILSGDNVNDVFEGLEQVFEEEVQK